MATATQEKPAKVAAVTPPPPGQPKVTVRYRAHELGVKSGKTSFRVVKTYWLTTGTGGEQEAMRKVLSTKFATRDEAAAIAAQLESGAITEIPKAARVSRASMTPEERKASAKAYRIKRRAELAAKLAQLEELLAAQAAQG